MTEVAKQSENGGAVAVAVTDRIAQIRGEGANSITGPQDSIPGTVAIMAMGKSHSTFTGLASQSGGRHSVCDEVWAINGMAGTVQADRVFAMDDLHIQQLRADAQPDRGVAHLLETFRRHPGPIYTSRKYDDWPNTVAFPLEDVLNVTKGPAYLNNTVAYAVAYAVYLHALHGKPEQIQLYGCDYGYRDVHKREKGRACTEHWLGIATTKGIEVAVPNESTLFDMDRPDEERIYGYDTEVITVGREDGEVKVDRRDRDNIPTAEEMERRYSHIPAVDASSEEAQ